MPIIFITAFIMLWPTLGFSSFDYSISSKGRSYPISAAFEANFGYNQLLRGDTTDFKYSYIRPNLTLTEFGTYHAAALALDIYPISFFKLAGGISREESNSNPAKIDCNIYDCQGRVNHYFFESTLNLQYKDYITSLTFNLDSATHPNGNRPFLEYDYLLPLNIGHDKIEHFEFMIGKELSADWTAIYALETAFAEKAKSSATANYVLAVWSKDQWEVGAGPGVFRSSLFDWGFSSAFWVNFNFGKSLELKKH